jgi:hypothetical protein
MLSAVLGSDNTVSMTMFSPAAIASLRAARANKDDSSWTRDASSSGSNRSSAASNERTSGGTIEVMYDLSPIPYRVPRAGIRCDGAPRPDHQRHQRREYRLCQF